MTLVPSPLQTPTAYIEKKKNTVLPGCQTHCNNSSWRRGGHERPADVQVAPASPLASNWVFHANSKLSDKGLLPQVLLWNSNQFIKCRTGLTPGWFSHSVVSDSSWPHGLSPARLLRPWNCPARILEWVATSISRGPSKTRDQTRVFCTAGRFSTDWTTKNDLDSLLDYSKLGHEKNISERA